MTWTASLFIRIFTNMTRLSQCSCVLFCERFHMSHILALLSNAAHQQWLLEDPHTRTYTLREKRIKHTNINSDFWNA